MSKVGEGGEALGTEACDDRLESEADAKELAGVQDTANTALQSASNKLGELGTVSKMNTALPGSPAICEDLAPGTAVHVVPLGKRGEVIKKGSKADDGVEVAIGIMQMKVPLQDLRVFGESRDNQAALPAPPMRPTEFKKPESGKEEPVLVIQTPTNNIDLRGMRADEGLDAAMSFVDKGVMRGEPYVILIHGHGTDRLKTLIRGSLKETNNYSMTFRPGNDQEGGDGVTIVNLI